MKIIIFLTNFKPSSVSFLSDFNVIDNSGSSTVPIDFTIIRLNILFTFITCQNLPLSYPLI